MASSHQNSSPDSLFVPQDEHYGTEQTAHRRHFPSLALPSRQTRYPGDGLDHRVPVMSGSSSPRNAAITQNQNTGIAAVIDLTREDGSQAPGRQPTSATAANASAASSRAQRLPHFGRNIIDLDTEGEEEEHMHRVARATSSQPNYMSVYPLGDDTRRYPHPRYSQLQIRQPQRHTMDDLELIEERTLPPSHSNYTDDYLRPRSGAPRSVTPYPNGTNEPIDLTGEDDDIVHVGTRARPRLNLERPNATAGAGTRSIAERLGELANMMDNSGRLHTRLPNARHRLSNYMPEQVPNHNRPRMNFGAAPLIDLGGFLGATMNYTAVGFDMGFEGGNRPSSPKYEPPPDAEPGFTRSPTEDDVVVCPNCGDELAFGDSDVKQEVWVIKKCGHAYCGACAQNRAKYASTRSKGKGKAPDFGSPAPFKRCVVDGCAQPASFKSMVHVYIGS